MDEAEEAAVDEQLHELRRQIAAAKHLGELAVWLAAAQAVVHGTGALPSRHAVCLLHAASLHACLSCWPLLQGGR